MYEMTVFQRLKTYEPIYALYTHAKCTIKTKPNKILNTVSLKRKFQTKQKKKKKKKEKKKGQARRNEINRITTGSELVIDQTSHPGI